MKILDPNLKDGIHEWRDGKRFVKEGDKLYLAPEVLQGKYGKAADIFRYVSVSYSDEDRG